MTALLVHSGSLTDVECALQLGWASIEILHASLPAQAMRLLETSRPSIVVIDTSYGGLCLAREVRRRSNAVIVAVAARYEESELIAAVEAGCDDYMQLPVSPTTFVARVRAALRRVTKPPDGEQPDVAACGSLRLDPACYEASVRGCLLHLTAKEFELLLHLTRHSGQVSRHEALAELIWGDDSEMYSPWLRKYIQHLRHKLAEAPDSDVAIVTVPRVGYKLVSGASTGVRKTSRTA
jgi:DNA-binding response OmpR family regulator